MLIKLQNITKVFGTGEQEVHALNNINLNVKQGEFVSVVGSSGSGKSTLLYSIGGLEKPSRGSVLINNQDIYEMSQDQLTIYRRRSIGFVFQSYNLIPILNVYDNIMLPSQLDGLASDKAYIHSIIHSLGIEEKLKSFPSQLSGGQQQRVAIARALSTKPQIILADEPTGNLDSKNSLEVMLLLKLLHEKYGQTIMMITHNEELASMSSRKIRIEDGRIHLDSGQIEQGEVV